jgi:DNA-binding NtrC family response regulator
MVRRDSEGSTRRAVRSGAGAQPSRVRQLVVVAAERRENLRTITLRASVVLGRKPTGERTLRIDDDEASRNHAVVEEIDGAWTLRDEGSRNGTFVDGKRAASAALRNGSVIRIGHALVVFVDVEIEAGIPLVAEKPPLLGDGISMMRVRGEIARVAPEAIPVLVLGESGVGKERVAEAIHAESGRKGPLVAINCAAIPAGIAESELFGHAVGAFTGASARADGVFASADGGTLFLDEVGELPEAVQAKLLRTIETGEVRALGKSAAAKYDVRVVAATNRDVEAGVGAGTFRGDLFARLAGWTIRVPPLREHREDVLRLASRILSARKTTLSTSAAEALLLHAWPFNVRELERVLAAAAVRADDGVVHASHLPAEIARAVSDGTPATEAPLDALVQRDAMPDGEDLRVVFERCGGNVTEVARFFGRDRRQVYRWLKRAGIDVTRLREE